MGMIDRFKQHPYLAHYLLYCFTLFLFAFQITGLGAYIPYMADQYDLNQTQYSFLFSCRSFGTLSGVIIFKFLQARHFIPNLHQAMAIALVFIWLLISLFASAESTLFQGLWFFLGALGYAFLQVIPNIVLVMINPPQTMETWLLFAHGSFGIGGLLGPVLVYLFEMNTFYVTSAMYLLLIPFYLRLATPESLNIQFEPYHEDEHGNKMKPIQATTWLVFLLGICLFLELGVQFNIGGWFPTFSIIAGSDTKESAGMYVTIFWVGITTMRFGMAYVPGTSSQKMKACLEIIMGVGIFVIIMVQFGYVHVACLIGCVLFGLAMAPLFPLIFSIVNEFNFRLSEHETSSIVMFAQISQGTLAAATGSLMEWFGYQVLVWWIIVIAFGMWCARHCTVQYMKREKGKVGELTIEMNNIQGSY